MQKANSLQGKWWYIIFILTALLIVVADQLSKLWIRSNLGIGESLFEVGFFRVTHVYNTGASFGLFQGQAFILTIVAAVGVAALLLYVFFFHRKYPIIDNRLGKLALGVLLGGAAGNLIDRIYIGHVTDFIDFNVWPTFNIADSAIVVGSILLAYSLIISVMVRKGSDG